MEERKERKEKCSRGRRRKLMGQVGGNWWRGRGNNRGKENRTTKENGKRIVKKGRHPEKKEAPETQGNERKEATRQMGEDETGGTIGKTWRQRRK